MICWFTKLRTFVICWKHPQNYRNAELSGGLGFFYNRYLFSYRKSMNISTLVGFETLIFTLKNPGRLVRRVHLEVRTIIDSESSIFRFQLWIFWVFFTRSLEDLSPKAQHLCVSEVRTDHTGLEIWIDIGFLGAPSSVQETLVVAWYRRCQKS